MAPPHWRQLSIANSVGLITIGTFAFIATLVQTPGLEGPVEIVPVAVVGVAFGAMALPLLWWDHPIGYAFSILAGAVAAGGMTAYHVGVFGPPRLAPAAWLFLALGFVLVGLSLAAWRERPHPG